MTTMVAPARHTASGSRGSWRQSYGRRLVVLDVVAVVVAVVVSSAVWVQGGSTVDLLGGASSPVPYVAVSVGIALAWIVALALFSSRDARVVGSGQTEYRRVAESSLVLFGLLAIGAYVGGVELGRAYLITCFLVGVLVLMFGRWAARQHLRRQQAAGRSLAPVVVVGDRFSADTVSEIAGFSGSGFRIVGVVSDEEIDTTASRIGRLDDLEEVIERTSPEAVIVTSVSALGQDRMRRLSWQLAKSGTDLIVAPGLAGIAGPRVLARPVADLPLLRIEYPELVGARAVAKRAFDVLGALALIVLSAPVMIVVAIAVAVTSPGGVFYRQERIGQRGVEFAMLKFRSMRADSDAQLQQLLREQGTDGTPLFKVRNDPRVTAVGRFIRKYSLDELPQFFNVLSGTMSLVGPRPQRAAEVALYEEFASRRHIVKPGVSGLWQVSGRSTLAWEDAIRLDLSYVDNWSLTGDIIILWRTMRAVVRPGAEAY